MAEKLPTPATTADMYAHATVLELRRLNGNLETLTKTLGGIVESVEADGDEAELKEPAEAKKPVHRDTKKASTKKS